MDAAPGSSSARARGGGGHKEHAMDNPNSSDFDLEGIDLEDFLAHPHWEVMDSEPDALARQLPKRATKFWRTTILTWIYLQRGVATFVELADRLDDVESVSMRKRMLRRVLRSMEKSRLITIVNFPDEEGEAFDEGDEVVGGSSVISITWTGMVWMRRAWNARMSLAKTTSLEVAHETICEEEDSIKGNDLYWVENLNGADREGVKVAMREIKTKHPRINSVFDLGSFQKK
jgi:hypothetical protein